VTSIFVPPSRGAEPSVSSIVTSVALRRRRRDQHCFAPRNRSRDRILQREKRGVAEHQRRLADGLRTVDRIFAVFARRPQARAELARQITRDRDFVGRGCVRAQTPACIEPDFLGRKPAHALHEAAFDLAQIDGGVERAPGIVQQLGTVERILAGQRVDRRFDIGGPVGEVIVGAALGCGSVEMDFGRAIETRRRQLNARIVGLLHRLFERQ